MHEFRVVLPRRVRFWVLFYTSFLPLKLVLSLPPALLNHSYADDVQAYKHCLASDARSAILSVSRATGLLNEWISSNRLCLNPLKTQYIWFGTRQQLAKLDLVSLAHEFPTFVFSTSVRDLGVILDQELSFAEHISSLTRSCFYQLCQLRVVSRPLSSSSTATTLVHAFTLNRLDYCSFLCLGLPYVRLRPSDGVLRAAARLIGGVSKFGHIGEFMRDTLYWLPVRQRILHRVSTIAWRCILGVAPAYLSELFVLSSSCTGRRSLRSASRGDYLIPRSYTATKQNRAFSAAGPSIWNGLSSDMKGCTSANKRIAQALRNLLCGARPYVSIGWLWAWGCLGGSL